MIMFLTVMFVVWIIIKLYVNAVRKESARYRNELSNSDDPIDKTLLRILYEEPEARKVEEARRRIRRQAGVE